jgi:hypothetical protein
MTIQNFKLVCREPIHKREWAIAAIAPSHENDQVADLVFAGKLDDLGNPLKPKSLCFEREELFQGVRYSIKCSCGLSCVVSQSMLTQIFDVVSTAGYESLTLRALVTRLTSSRTSKPNTNKEISGSCCRKCKTPYGHAQGAGECCHQK